MVDRLDSCDHNYTGIYLSPLPLYLCICIYIYIYTYIFTHDMLLYIQYICIYIYRHPIQPKECGSWTNFEIKSPCYHQVITFPDSPCSNEFLLSLSYPVLSTCIPSAMRISDSRIRYLGHILRHPDSVESLILFNNSFSLRTISSTF